ncbi:MAG: malto-oligosyltrehalose trehalohydrolase [Vampirovibrionia bacterium]
MSNNDNKTSFEHIIPFGVNLNSDNTAVFRLWAPDATNIKLHLFDNNGAKTVYNMLPDDEKNFSVCINGVKAGYLYQFQIDEGLLVPDPVSKCQYKDVHGPSVIVEPTSFNWGDEHNWKGLPWNETIIYELHVGTFTPEGTFKALKDKLDYFVELGITAIELMPIADFPGKFNWGYDGVLQFAPERNYGTPDDLKELIKAAHQKGIMVFLDVVYNHFGPDGNYLYVYAKSKFFSDKFKTPWGDAINFNEKIVREFFINNALYWINEFRFDGLRFDAIHAIKDSSIPDITKEIALRIRTESDKYRHIHLILENNGNESRYLKIDENLKPYEHTAQWNDDVHHAVHTALTNEKDGYYCDYTKEITSKPLSYYLARSLSEGFAYQGDRSVYRNNKLRGESTKNLTPLAFINFIQNHDQTGNRAFGDRLNMLIGQDKYKLAAALYILNPSIQMLFMGEEFSASDPFLFFCDFDENLADSVRNGRQEEFAKFPQFQDKRIRETIPDPLSEQTFLKSKLSWDKLNSNDSLNTYKYYKLLLKTRKEFIIPLINKLKISNTSYEILNDASFLINWSSCDGDILLSLVANLGNQEVNHQLNIFGNLLFSVNINEKIKNILPAYSAAWYKF